MVTAYIMVKANTGEADRLKGEILDLGDGVVDASIVAGDVDFIVKANVETPVDVKDIASAIQAVDGIEDTQTYIAMD
ncbi:Lrp/AsnC ligand binding domain-containing protein [Salinigranum halophilum]|jgi:DNA-binding Lrp family transcriptional regulator|uniref:Lrp/AsnC ligand binding domain-containing protein n=1 Tax=Salinigranum halophilum TaxID=2565931 RepID=UPI0010A8AAD3|nr:Lrp/AsnC ligand binding domain-containing protein [Salinigranum halophilum]